MYVPNLHKYLEIEWCQILGRYLLGTYLLPYKLFQKNEYPRFAHTF